VDEPGRPRQHHKTLAIVTAAGLFCALIAVVGVIMLPPGETWWHLVAAPPEDGAWKFNRIDGVDVRDDGYALGVRWGEIRAFDDGCNSCSFDDDKPMGSADRRMMMCTLVACPAKPNDALFARFAHGAPAMRANGDRLTLTLRGHRADLVRVPPNSGD